MPVTDPILTPGGSPAEKHALPTDAREGGGFETPVTHQGIIRARRERELDEEGRELPPSERGLQEESEPRGPLHNRERLTQPHAFRVRCLSGASGSPGGALIPFPRRLLWYLNSRATLHGERKGASHPEEGGHLSGSLLRFRGFQNPLHRHS